MKHIQLRILLKETIVENHQPKEQVDEAIVSLVAGAVAAIPGILKGLGWIAKKAGKWIGSEKLQSIGETGSEWGDKLHHKYIGWVQKLLWPLFKALKIKDEKTKEKVANIAFLILIGALAADAGMSAYDAFSNSQVALGAGESGLSALKIGEVGIEGSNAAFRALINSMNLTDEMASKIIQTGAKL